MVDRLRYDPQIVDSMLWKFDSAVEQVRESIGADSLAYLSIYGMVGATGQGTSLCIGCFTGEYPETIPAGTPVPGTPDATPC